MATDTRRGRSGAASTASFAAGSLAVAGAAALAPWIWTTGGLQRAMLIAAFIPFVQQPEGMAGAVLLVRNRYDLRGLLLLWAMALRLAAIAVGASISLVGLFVAVVLAQVLSTVTAMGISLAVYRRYPAAPPAPLGGDAREIRRFAVQSSVASGLTSLRTSLPTVLVGVVASPAQTADFRAAQAPATAAASLSAPARLVLLAEQTRDIEHGRSDRAMRLLGHYLLATAGLACVLTPIGWWAMPTLIRLVYGEKWVAASDPFRVMLLAAMVQLVFAWTKSFPVSIGRPGLRTAGQVLEIAVLVPAVLLLARSYGATGAALGVLAGAVVLASFWALRLVELRRQLA
jgi:O-antigen/teichoic acid export membrane protein